MSNLAFMVAGHKIAKHGYAASAAAAARGGFQTCSVSRGSTVEPLLDVAQNPFHRPASALGRRRAFALQNRPFGTHALQAEFQRDVQQLPKPGPP